MKNRIIACAFMFMAALAWGAAGTPTATAGSPPEADHTSGKPARTAEPSGMVIKSDTLEVDDTAKVVIFTGGVNATKDNLTISCDRMVVHYVSAPGRTDPAGRGKTAETATRVDRIVATGNVVIRRAEGGVATARKAVYFENADKVVLTDHPRVRRGRDFVEGTRITLFLKQNRSVVEGSGDKKVRAVIFPGSKEK